jgi:hypothetical protein
VDIQKNILGLWYVKNVTSAPKNLLWLNLPCQNENWVNKKNEGILMVSETELWKSFSDVHFYKRNLHSERIIEFI